MWVLPINRRELVDLLSAQNGSVPGAVEEVRPYFDIVRSDKLVAVWPADPTEFGRMPTAIIVPEGVRKDTLAWLSTYVRDFRPFTAYCRVVERPIAEQFLSGPAAPSLSRAEGICSGLILGESLMHARGRASILDLPFTAYSATLSHAIARTFALTGGSIPQEMIAQLWTQAREITGQNGLIVSPNVILSVWSVALGMSRHTAPPRSLFASSNILTAAWTEWTSSGQLRDPLWHDLVEGYPDLDRMRDLLSIPREQRVQLIDMALRSLVLSVKGDDERRSFLAGYFTSLLGPGTLNHADFLEPVASMLPASYLWYGLFAGINPRGDALPVGNPLARRIVRDLTIPDRIIDRPSCDVAIEELSMHGSAENLLKMTSKAGRLDIDILPGVTTSVRWPPHDALNAQDFRRDRELEAGHLLMEMEETTARWQHLTGRLRDVLRLGDDERQQPPKKKRGGGKR